IHAIAQEGARNHGLLNICIEDFFNTYIHVPPIEEQTAIAEILSAQDKEIELLEKELDLQKQKKKALMQLLLSGK
ncbi:MAG: restriction endonuclease subunit S, partial [Ruminococcus sp.]|nr:restriction endonuclease subunit S [Ruminococcus sp.]